MMRVDVLTNGALVFLVFIRVGAILAFLPGFSASYISPRIRLLLALALSVVLAPTLAGELPPLPKSLAAAAGLILSEALIGVFLGVIPRIALAAMQAAGTFTAYFASLANALVQDPVADQQSATLAGFYGVMALVLIFVTDLHHLMLAGLADSYRAFPAGTGLLAGDAAAAVIRAVAASFAIGLTLSLPALIGALLSNIALGLLGRLMPQLNVFFFGLPIQISLQLTIMMLTFTGMGIVFLNFFSDTLTLFGSS
jgi:flagellar biosynthetic protein FliR